MGENIKSLHKSININKSKTSTNSNNITKDKKLKKWWERMKNIPKHKLNSFIQK